MGHSNASVTVQINDSNRNATPRQILSDAVWQWRDEEAGRWDDARDGDGLRTKPMLKHQTSWYINEHDREVVDHSLVIPVITDVVSVEKTVKVTVPGEMLKQFAAGWTSTYDLRLILVKEYGEAVSKFEVIGLPKPRKAVATATEGKAVTTYVVISGGHIVDKGATQAEARQKAVDFVNSHPAISDVTVEAVVSRDTGDKALVRIARPVPETATVAVKLTLTTAKKGAVPSEYLVVFDYHH